MHRLPIPILALCVWASMSCDDSKKAAIVADAANAADADVDARAEGMSTSKREALCAAADAWAENAAMKTELKAALCRFTGFFAAAAARATTTYDLQASCSVARNGCLADNPPMMPSVKAICDLPANCDVEANELRACMDDWVATLKISATAFHGCETLAPRDFEEERVQQIAATLHVRPPSCALVQSKCQGFLNLGS